MMFQERATVSGACRPIDFAGVRRTKMSRQAPPRTGAGRQIMDGLAMERYDFGPGCVHHEVGLSLHQSSAFRE